MQYRKLGGSGLKLSELSFGSWVTFNKQVDSGLAERMFGMCFDAGINFFDNAEGYEAGESEIVMGKALKSLGRPRDSYCVSSKVFFGATANPMPTQQGLSRKHVTEACHRYVRIPSVVFSLVIISGFLQLVEAVVFYLFGVGVGVEMNFVTYVLVVPMIYVAASLPLSIGGLGVREAAAVTLFMAVGMSEGDAGAVSFLYIPILLSASLPGLVYFMMLKNNKKYFEDATHSKMSV